MQIPKIHAMKKYLKWAKNISQEKKNPIMYLPIFFWVKQVVKKKPPGPIRKGGGSLDLLDPPPWI